MLTRDVGLSDPELEAVQLVNAILLDLLDISRRQQSPPPPPEGTAFSQTRPVFCPHMWEARGHISPEIV